MQLSELSTLLRAVADAIDSKTHPATHPVEETPTPEAVPSEPVRNVTHLYGSPPPAVEEKAAPAPEPTQATEPTVSKEDVIGAFQALTQRIGQQEGTAKVIETLKSLGISRVSEANQNQLQTLYARAKEHLNAA